MNLKIRLMVMFDRVVLRTMRGFLRRTATNPPTAVSYVQHMTARESAEFIKEHLHKALLYYHRFELMDYVVKAIPTEGHLLEFGVFEGHSLGYLANELSPRKIFGFDSFKGLAESWGGSDKMSGSFDLHGKLPKVPKNAFLVPGWFDESLPRWLDGNPGKAAFIHIDSDTYEACKCVLELMKERIDSATIILFDEHHGYPGWKHGEFKALNEFVEAQGLTLEYLAFSETGAAVRILS